MTSLNDPVERDRVPLAKADATRATTDPAAGADDALVIQKPIKDWTPSVGPRTRAVLGPVNAPAASTNAEVAPHRRPRWVWLGIVLLWLVGLGAGFLSALAVAARASCAGSAGGFGCGNGGSAVGIALVLIVIGVVGTTTVYALDARESPRVWLRYLVLALIALALVVVAARLVVSTL